MVDADKKRFLAVMQWLCDRYRDGDVPRPLPPRSELAEYFDALRDLRIEDLEQAKHWHFGHSEYFPERPAALRKSVEAWRAANPMPQAEQPSRLPDYVRELRQERQERQHRTERAGGCAEIGPLGQQLVRLFDDLSEGVISQAEYESRFAEICGELL